MSFLLLKSFVKKLLIFLTSLYISLLFIEVLLIYTDLDRKSKRSDLLKIIEIKKKEIEFDNRSMIQYYLDYKKKNPKAVLSTTSTGLNSHLDSTFSLNDGTKVFPLSGISKRETILCNELGYFAKYESDKYGFNNTSKWSNKYDFLLIGDSAVEGYCVNEKDNLSGNLKRLLKKNNSVLNLGRGANGPLKNYAILKEYIDLIDTKNILYFHVSANDIQDLQIELKNPILKKYYNDKNYSQNLSSIQNLIDENLILKLDNILEKSIEENKILKDKKYHFKKFVKLNRTIRFKNKTLRQIKNKNERTSDFSKEYTFGNLIENDFRNILKQMKDLADKKKINFYFIYWPSYYSESGSYKNKEKIINLNDQYYHDVLSVVTELKIPIINLKDALYESEKDPLSLIPFRVLGHFNEKGYKLLSEIIFDYIKKN